MSKMTQKLDIIWSSTNFTINKQMSLSLILPFTDMYKYSGTAHQKNNIVLTISVLFHFQCSTFFQIFF